ncbi:unnamed protein product [Callosobruchus maculatus]|uniref:Uncharacterized protein n=1 Tax=Callosobruchus maculatus TaxID=64391 RepID=A0A653CBT2_CALMS|nr:unnamed protein product [Callosobruchus maculatus]
MNYYLIAVKEFSLLKSKSGGSGFVAKIFKIRLMPYRMAAEGVNDAAPSLCKTTERDTSRSGGGGKRSQMAQTILSLPRPSAVVSGENSRKCKSQKGTVVAVIKCTYNMNMTPRWLHLEVATEKVLEDQHFLDIDFVGSIMHETTFVPVWRTGRGTLDPSPPTFYNVGMTQHNNVGNEYGKTLDLVVGNIHVDVSRAIPPIIEEDAYHPALHITVNAAGAPDESSCSSCAEAPKVVDDFFLACQKDADILLTEVLHYFRRDLLEVLEHKSGRFMVLCCHPFGKQANRTSFRAHHTIYQHPSAVLRSKILQIDLTRYDQLGTEHAAVLPYFKCFPSSLKWNPEVLFDDLSTRVLDSQITWCDQRTSALCTFRSKSTFSHFSDSHYGSSSGSWETPKSQKTIKIYCNLLLYATPRSLTDVRAKDRRMVVKAIQVVQQSNYVTSRFQLGSVLLQIGDNIMKTGVFQNVCRSLSSYYNR